MKLQVNISNEMCAEIDEIAQSIGVSRSALCAVWIGQMLRNQKKSLALMDEFGDIFKDKIKDEIKNKINDEIVNLDS